MTQSSFAGRLSAVAAAVAMASLAPAPVRAQEPVIEEVVVTGSRIARDPNTAGAAPVSSLSEEDLKLSGQPDLADVLRQQPALLTSVSSLGSTDSVFAAEEGGTPGFGQSVLQLRGLGNERTLVLVNGRRHVAGVEGSQAVDINSIPNALVERVEVLTGGASAIYGADAVTGVVNFILKDDFEGVDLDVQGGLSGEQDGETLQVSGLFGRNFADGRGNVTLGIDVFTREEIRYGDRGFLADNRRGVQRNNPELRFQSGDISAAATPNFAQFYTVDNGRYPYGFNIPSADSFAVAYEEEFGVAPTLTDAERALIDRAQNAPPRTIDSFHTFSISSERGVVVGDGFNSDTFVDTDGNGTNDCFDSFLGFNSLLEGEAFGLAGGCWVLNDDGSVRPYQDGRVASNFNQYGGDGVQGYYDPGYLTPDEQRFTINLNGRFDLTDSLRVFGEGKYSRQEVSFGGPLNTFYDLIFISPENPYIPEALQPLADADGGLRVTRDPTDLGSNVDENVRETMRFVVGLEGELANGWTWDVAANYGRFERRFLDSNAVVQDRYFAAIDAVADPDTGQPICRSDVDPFSRPPTTFFGIPAFDPGFFTFNPGDGQCRPLSLLSGPVGATPEAVDFVTTTTTDTFTLEQTVFTANLAGEVPAFELPGGRIGFAVGAEYREEKNEQEYDPLVRGVIPVSTIDGAAGQRIRDLPNVQNSLVFDPEQLLTDSDGEYDVYDLYGELLFPLLSDRFLARELTLNTAYRFSDYSTVGRTHTWNLGVSWAPTEDVKLRGTRSRAVRAPNIFELFSPDISATFRPDDPCEQAAIDALSEAGDPRGANRAANCATDGIPAGFVDPLSARFSGVIAGNRELDEETADTITYGVVFEPRLLSGLTVTVDYWDIEIEDAIEAVDDQDIVNSCYSADPSTFPNQFCQLFTRNRTEGSAQFLGFNFLRQTQLNFGALEAAGVDFTAAYQFEALAADWQVSGSGSWFDRIDRFFDPGDPNAVDPELGELQRPELAGQFAVDFMKGPLTLRWTTYYQDEQQMAGIEIEDAVPVFGGRGQEDEIFFHDLSFSYELRDFLQVYGGINNVTDEQPFFTENAWPVSPVGRFGFLGVTYRR
jgi:outer membrane receptor protein involved in Fe transport